MKKILLIIILLFSIFIFFITHDYKSITQITFVNSIGIDYSEESDEFTLYYFVLNNYNIAQTGNSAAFTNTHAYVTKASDKELLLAENKIRNNSNTKIDLSHVRSIVIKDTFFKKNNIIKLIDYIKNSNKYNPSFEVYTTDDNLDEIYKLDNFSEVSGYYTILVNTQNNIPVKHITYSDLCNDIYIDNFFVPYQKIKVNKGIINDSEKEYVTLSYDGCTFINESLQTCSFKYHNIHGLAYFTTKINRPIIINNNNHTYSLSVNLFKINYYIKDGKLLLTIKINGSFIDVNNEDATMLKGLLKDKITKDILEMNEILINYDIDFFNIKYMSKGKINYKDIPIVFKYSISLNN